MVYTLFNIFEGLLWLAFAIVLPLRVKGSNPRQRKAILLGSFGFLLFGITDFLEAPSGGLIPLWLWGMKIISGLVLFCSRFTYIGWNRFKITDRYFLFGIVSLIAALLIIWLNMSLES